MPKNNSTPAANAAVSRLKRHTQSSAKLDELMSTALPASHAATSPLSTSKAPAPSTMARSRSFATGHGRRPPVSQTSLRAARTPPNRRGEDPPDNDRPQ